MSATNPVCAIPDDVKDLLDRAERQLRVASAALIRDAGMELCKRGNLPMAQAVKAIGGHCSEMAEDIRGYFIRRRLNADETEAE